MIPNYTKIMDQNLYYDEIRYMVQGVSCYLCHRTDGPAIISKDGRIFWCVNGIFIKTTEEYCRLCEYTPEETVIMILKYGDVLPTESSHFKS